MAKDIDFSNNGATFTCVIKEKEYKNIEEFENKKDYYDDVRYKNEC